MKKAIILISLFFALTGISESNEVNIFSARHYDSDVQLYEKFISNLITTINENDYQYRYVALNTTKKCIGAEWYYVYVQL